MLMLTIDGGGVRGLYGAHILELMTKAFKINMAQRFDLICGTSAGAIIAAGLALDLPVEKLVALFSRDNDQFFKPETFSVGGIVKQKYSLDGVRELLNEYFGDATLSDAKTKLMLTSADISNGRTYLFKSYPSRQFLRHKDVKMVDAVIASCSAPIYLRPVYLEPYLMVDGGVWATNPSHVAVAEALSLGYKLSSLRLLSIGTGTQMVTYSLKEKDSAWGLATTWGLEKLSCLLVSVQVTAAQNFVSRVLNKDQLVRLNYFTESVLAPDDAELLVDLRSKAAVSFTKNISALAKLLEVDKIKLVAEKTY